MAKARTRRFPVLATASLSVSICGSYNKHLKEMRAAMAECKRLGIHVLIPKYAEKKYSKNRFVYLKGERGTPKQLQEKNFEAITRSSFILVVDPDGYVGTSTAMEIGFSIAKGIPVFLTDSPNDYVFRFYTEYGRPLAKIKSLLLARHGIELN
ncbi:MAG: hypothetical protein ACRECH_09340 [Nitrososphaerales archaeon]